MPDIEGGVIGDPGAAATRCRCPVCRPPRGEAGPDSQLDLGDVLLDEFQVISERRRVIEDKDATISEAQLLGHSHVCVRTKLLRYRELVHEAGDVSALCLSGGGIRSAAFALGVVQGLAAKQVLHRFDYLSTVSGGGYLGGFLTAWVARSGYKAVREDLDNTRPLEFDEMGFHSPIDHLRRYSSYLAPRRALFSSDMLTIGVIYVRNLLLNWCIVIPLLMSLVLAVKLLVGGLAVFGEVFHENSGSSLVSGLGAVGVCIYAVVTLESLRQRPGLESQRFGRREFVAFQLLPMFIASLIGVAITQVNGSPTSMPVAKIVAGFTAVNLIAWLLAYFVTHRPEDDRLSTKANLRTTDGWLPVFTSFAGFSLSGAVTGLIVGSIVWGEQFLSTPALSDFLGLPVRPEVRASLAVAIGPLAFVGAYLTGEIVHIALSSTMAWGDGEREWLASAAGYHVKLAVSCLLLVLVVAIGPAVAVHFLKIGDHNLLAVVGPIGGASGLVSALLGKSSSTSAGIRERLVGWRALSAQTVIAIATPVFLVALLILLSVWADALASFLAPLLGLRGDGVGLARLSAALVATTAFALLASRLVNANRFSLHALYRNRLIRAFLGASRASDFERRPNGLTGFDERDNVDLHELWPQRPAPSPSRAGDAGLVPPNFLVVNCALNVLRTSKLSLQERKAVSFSATPRSVGSPSQGNNWGEYRRATEYAEGLSLGTAMTISGAAISPNMGYHSSPALSLVMTMFNVRLGAWLGNPGSTGSGTFTRSGPRLAARTVVSEALGRATDSEPYVYLSDGGHFENLGLYEMVLRRCRFIVISDAGCDPKGAFDDLGNAVRKISIDHQIGIEFDVLQIPTRFNQTQGGSCFALARVSYPEEDVPDGVIVYVKPAYIGDEPVSVRSYAEANPSFPHEPTSDQQFGERKFEAYRALGEHIIRSIDGDPGKSYQSVEDFCNGVSRHAKAKASSGADGTKRGRYRRTHV
ncbi:MAG: patatin-like phospholipase family protein [Xanthobacteraceae bacterium]|nr:patatin-like phospholipase family protein [Xanthobacteraceae bacterium]